MSFRTKDYYTTDEDWDTTGIDVAFFSGHQNSDLLLRSIIVAMILLDLYTLVLSLLTHVTLLKIGFLCFILLLMSFTIPFRANLRVLHLEYKRMDVFVYKKYPLIKPIQLKDYTVFLKDFKSASISKVNMRLSPYWQIILKFNNSINTVKIPFREDIPYKIHHAVYYKLNRHASAEVKTSLTALQKFYPYFEFKKGYEHVEYRYLILLSYLLSCLIFTLVFPLIIA